MYEFINQKTVRFYPNEKGNFSSGDIGDATEMLFKFHAGVKKWDVVSPTGKPDFARGFTHYDVKQNGSPIVYGDSCAVKGSSRVIYATHIDVEIIELNEQYKTIQFNLEKTEFFIVDKKSFVKFLKDNNLCKENATRRQVNIQTVFNYSKNAPHGKKGAVIREWCRENEVDTDFKAEIIASILAN